LAGELAGKYIIASIFPIDEEVAGFLGSMGGGAACGACFGGPWGAAGGAVVGAGSWVIGETAGRGLDTLVGTSKNDMTFKFPDDDEPDVDFEGQSQLFYEKVTEEGGVGSFFSLNKREIDIQIPDNVLVCKILVESHWKDGSNGHAEITEIADGNKKGPTFPLIGPTTLHVYIEAAPSRGFNWSVWVYGVDFEQCTGQKVG